MEPASAANSTTMALVDGHAVPEEAVRSELERVLASPTLRDSDLLKRFLRNIVECTLTGEGDQLKEYRLGMEVFDRDSSFDPKIDPVVRMTARRLRAKLHEYYEKEGSKDGVRIEVPKGAYAACFVSASTPEMVAGKGAVEQVDGFSPEQSTVLPLGWKRRLAALAVLVIAGFVAGIFYSRSLQARRLTDKDTIVLVDFANSTGDPVFDDTLKTALGISLHQSPFLNVLPDSEVTKTLQQMSRPVSTKLTSDVARELCQRAGSKAYVAGAIASLGSDYVLQLKAVNCQNGDTLAQEQMTTASKEKVLDILGKAASKLRGKLGESLASVEKYDVPLVDCTTPSLEALKAFSIGQKVLREKSVEAALPYDKSAIELDPNFAIGQFEVGSDYSNLGQPGRAREFFTRAFELRGRTSEHEKLAIAGAYYRNVTGELDKALQTHQQEIEIYPREFLAFIRLGVDFAFEGQYEKAAEVTRRALLLDPDHTVAYGNLVNYRLASERLDEARHLIQEAQTRKLDSVMLHNALYALAFFETNSTMMAAQQRWYSGTPQETYGLALASDTEAYVGHLAKARALTKQALEAALRTDGKETGAIWQANAAVREAAFGNPADAQDHAATALKLAPTSQGVQVEAALAFALARNGARTEVVVQELNKRFPLDTQMQFLWLPVIRAQQSLYRNPSQAAYDLQVTSPIELGLVPFANNISCLYSAYVRGEALLAAADGAKAAAEFQTILDHRGIVWNCWTGALAHLGVARANALQARTTQNSDADDARIRAIAAYQDFLTLWKDGDPDIPILKQARAEYAKLR